MHQDRKARSANLKAQKGREFPWERPRRERGCPAALAMVSLLPRSRCGEKGGAGGSLEGPWRVPGCCVGAAVVTSWPSAGRALGLWKSPFPRAQGRAPGQNPPDIPDLHTGRGTGGWMCCWDAAGAGPGLTQGWGQRERESSVWGLGPVHAEPERLHARVLPGSGVAVGSQGCSDLSPCPMSMAWL